MSTPNNTPAKAKASTEFIPGLSMGEAKLLLMGLVCSGEQSLPKVDYEKLAQMGGYKNGSSASVMYLKAKRKFFDLHAGGNKEVDDNATGDTTTGTTTKKPRTPAKRKNPAPVDTTAPADGGEATTTAEGVIEATPTTKPKRQRKTPARKAVPVKKEATTAAVDTEAPVKSESAIEPQVKRNDTDDEILNNKDLSDAVNSDEEKRVYKTEPEA